MPTSVNMEEIRQRISVINAQSSQINNARSVNLGRKQTLESQLDNLIKTYNSKYGVQLTTETLEEEIVKVANEKEEECRKLSEVLEAINSQDYARANQLLGVPVDSSQENKEITQSSDNESNSSDIQAVAPQVASNSVEQIPTQMNNTTPPVQSQVLNEQVTVPPIVEVPNTFVAPPTQAVLEAPPVFNTGTVAPPQMNSVGIQPPVGVSAPPTGASTISGAEFMQEVQETSKAPMPALEGFTKGVGSLTGLGVPNLDVAPPTAPQGQPKSFSDILGGNKFMNN